MCRFSISLCKNCGTRNKLYMKRIYKYVCRFILLDIFFNLRIVFGTYMYEYLDVSMYLAVTLRAFEKNQLFFHEILLVILLENL